MARGGSSGVSRSVLNPPPHLQGRSQALNIPDPRVMVGSPAHPTAPDTCASKCSRCPLHPHRTPCICILPVCPCTHPEAERANKGARGQASCQPSPPTHHQHVLALSLVTFAAVTEFSSLREGRRLSLHFTDEETKA